MSYKPHPHENPAGADPPAVRFQWSQKQVLLVLLGVAVLSAVWQYCQINLMVPGVPVKWQPFTREIAESARRRQAGLLILVSANTADGKSTGQEVVDSGAFRKAVFRSRAVTLHIDPSSDSGRSSLEWLSDQLRENEMSLPGGIDAAPAGGLIVSLAGDPRKKPAIAILEPGRSAEAVIQTLFD